MEKVYFDGILELCTDLSLSTPPKQDASHHQDYYIILVGNPYKPSFVTGILDGGVDPTDLYFTRGGGGMVRT